MCGAWVRGCVGGWVRACVRACVCVCVRVRACACLICERRTEYKSQRERERKKRNERRATEESKHRHRHTHTEETTTSVTNRSSALPIFNELKIHLVDLLAKKLNLTRSTVLIDYNLLSTW